MIRKAFLKWLVLKICQLFLIAVRIRSAFLSLGMPAVPACSRLEPLYSPSLSSSTAVAPTCHVHSDGRAVLPALNTLSLDHCMVVPSSH